MALTLRASNADAAVVRIAVLLLLLSACTTKQHHLSQFTSIQVQLPEGLSREDATTRAAQAVAVEGARIATLTSGLVTTGWEPFPIASRRAAGAVGRWVVVIDEFGASIDLQCKGAGYRCGDRRPPGQWNRAACRIARRIAGPAACDVSVDGDEPTLPELGNWCLRSNTVASGALGCYPDQDDCEAAREKVGGGNSWKCAEL